MARRRRTKRLKGGDKTTSRTSKPQRKITRFSSRYGPRKGRRAGRRRKTYTSYRGNGSLNINWAALKELTWKQWIGLLTFLAVIGLVIILWWCIKRN